MDFVTPHEPCTQLSGSYASSTLTHFAAPCVPAFMSFGSGCGPRDERSVGPRRSASWFGLGLGSESGLGLVLGLGLGLGSGPTLSPVLETQRLLPHALG
eukprot:scaffold38195_cov64-Phaeocystis_antarctica.AAC.13